MLLSSVLVAITLSFGCGGPPESARLAQHYLAQGQFDEADSAADRALQKHPKDPTAWRVKIRVAMGRGTLDRGIALYREWKTLRGAHDSSAYRMMAMSDLWHGLRVPSPEIQARSIRIVELHRIEKLADEVRRHLGSDSDLVAAAAAAALVTSHPAAPRIAVDLLASDNPRARAIVVRSIGKKAGRIARADIFPALNDPDAGVRRAAVGAIALWKNSDDRKRLINAARTDKDGQVRARAMRALLTLGGNATLALARQKLSQDVLPGQSTSHYDSYVGARLAAIAILDKRGGNDIVPPLEKLRSSEDISIALRAAIALQRRQKRDNMPLLQRAVQSDNAATRAAAIHSASALLDNAQAVSFGDRALLDSDGHVRLAAARMLLHLGAEEQALTEMRKALYSDALLLRLQAAGDLAKRGEAEALALLSTLATRGSPDEREAAIYAHRDATVVTDGLISALGDNSIAVRLAAADVILGK